MDTGANGGLLNICLGPSQEASLGSTLKAGCRKRFVEKESSAFFRRGFCVRGNKIANEGCALAVLNLTLFIFQPLRLAYGPKRGGVSLSFKIAVSSLHLTEKTYG